MAKNKKDIEEKNSVPVTIKMLLDQYTEILRKIYGSHLKTVILYGSYARGDYKADSDIDIMILLDLSDIDIKQYRHDCQEKLLISIWIMILTLNR